ncbi:MAG: hypothetical protein ACQETD_10515 [Pseudomonadota bacterium]
MNRFSIGVAGIALTLLITACGGGSNTRPESTQSAADNSGVQTAVDGVIHVQQLTPYAEGRSVDAAVKSECEINRQLPEFIHSYAAENGIAVSLKPKVSADDEGHNLVVEIVRAHSDGNAFIGHRKYAEIKAVLYKDGEEIADLTAGRRSGGGLFGGYKGSCSVMGRTVKALGQDVALWLKAPGPGMHKGDI